MGAHGDERDASRAAGCSAAATLRSAKSFIEAHSSEPITIAQIAAGVHVTPRSVQYAFTAEQITPMGYLLRTRLTCAHADLLAAVPHDGVTVTGVAADCGFGHQGRFAAAYRDRYGVAPATTLRA